MVPPIERLCDPIEGTDRARLAECLGLDPNRYRTIAAGESEEKSFGTLDSLMSDAQRFKDADPFLVRCRSCQNSVPFGPLNEREVCCCTSHSVAKYSHGPVEITYSNRGPDVPTMSSCGWDGECANAAGGADP